MKIILLLFSYCFRCDIFEYIFHLSISTRGRVAKSSNILLTKNLIHSFFLFQMIVLSVLNFLINNVSSCAIFVKFADSKEWNVILYTVIHLRVFRIFVKFFCFSFHIKYFRFMFSKCMLCMYLIWKIEKPICRE